jgi:hypothetical protein
MTHDATFIVLTPLSHGTHFTFTLDSLSLSLYSISSLCFSSSSREEVVKDVEENKEEGEGVLRRDHAMASGAQLFIYFFLSTIYGVLFFLL